MTVLLVLRDATVDIDIDTDRGRGRGITGSTVGVGREMRGEDPPEEAALEVALLLVVERCSGRVRDTLITEGELLPLLLLLLLYALIVLLLLVLILVLVGIVVRLDRDPL